MLSKTCIFLVKLSATKIFPDMGWIASCCGFLHGTRQDVTSENNPQF